MWTVHLWRESDASGPCPCHVPTDRGQSAQSLQQGWQQVHRQTGQGSFHCHSTQLEYCCLAGQAGKWIMGYFPCSWDFPCRSAWIFVSFAMHGSELWVISLAAGISLVDQLECFGLVCHAGQWIMGCFPSRSYSQTWRIVHWIIVWELLTFTSFLRRNVIKCLWSLQCVCCIESPIA